MGYRIVYGEQRKRTLPIRRFFLGAICVLIAALLIWPAGRNALQQIFLPGDADVTASALRNLTEDLHDGVAIGDAVTAFCQEIIAGEN